MSSKSELTLTFLDRLPHAAAVALQELPHEEAYAFMETVPARIAAPVVDEMIPWNAARLLESLTTERATMILRQLPFSDAVTLTRLVQVGDRERLFAELPTKLATRLASALRYPVHQVGAWIDPQVATLSTSDSVMDALRVLRTAENASHVFIEAPGHGAYIGTISIAEILSTTPEQPLENLEIEHTQPVSNRTSLASIAFDERWDTFLHLPVVGRRGNLLGGLSRKTLRESAQPHAAHVYDDSNPLLRPVASALFLTAMTLIDVVRAPARPDPTPRVGASSNER